jgi:trans-aconitate 2-methyltransferase
VGREWDSAAYHRLSDPQFRWALKVVERLESLGLRADEQILDAGCGTGRVTAELLRRFPDSQITAVDASENMVREARLTLRQFGGRVTVEQRDLLELPYSNAFDVVFSTAVFHWIKDHARLFAVLFRVLKPGGTLLAQCGGAPNLKRVRDRIQRLMESEKFKKYFAGRQRVWEYPTPELTRERLQRAGFRDVSSSLEAAPVAFSDRQQYAEFLAAMILHPYLERLPAHLHPDFQDELVRQAAQDQPPFVFDYWRLNMYCRKAA